MTLILSLFINFSLLLISVSVHEFAHGWTAYKLGDRTAKDSGRLTLNPLAHIDPIGTILIPILLFMATNGRFVFGAAKPVPVNFWRLKNPKNGMIWVGASGPIANFIFAGILSILRRILPPHPLANFIFVTLISINVILGVFNLIPIPPLDGSRIVMGLLPKGMAEKYSMLEPFGFIIVIALIYLGLFNAIVAPIASFILSKLITPF